MNRTLAYWLGLVAALLVIASWLTWAYLGDGGNWKKFDALGVLISGLAFVGLVVTVYIQLSQILGQEQSTRDSLNAQREITQVLALSAARDFAGRRIDHLKKLIAQGTTESENISSTEAESEIAELRSMIPKIEKQLHALAVKAFTIDSSASGRP